MWRFSRKKYSVLWNRYQETCRECDKYRQENEELKEKIHQYEDWIEKMRADQKIKTYLADSFFKRLTLFSL